MSESLRDDRLLSTFAKLADTLVADYDVVDLLQLLVDSCRELLDVSEAGILLADEGGELELVASTSESSRIVETMQLAAEQGPCIESFRGGTVVSVPDIAASAERWRTFAQGAAEQGFLSAFAIPMRLRDTTIGTLNLLRRELGDLESEHQLAAQAFADVATIGILHERSLRESAILAEQLQSALNSRVLIEQAKGVVSQTRGIPIDEAFTVIRNYARSHQTGVSAVAAQIVDRRLTL
jgi:GAF domain-containing protein